MRDEGTRDAGRETREDARANTSDAGNVVNVAGTDDPTGEAPTPAGLESADLKHHARPPPGLLRHRWVVSSPVERGL